MRHLNYVLLACLLLAGLWMVVRRVPSADGRVAWLGDHAASVRTLDPSDEDFADLEALGAAIGDSRVVLLGEATHGDGAASLAKARMVKYLHQRMGFDVVAWEAGFYDTAKAGEALVGAEVGTVDDVLPSWSESVECRRVVEYVRDSRGTHRPIALVGMSLYTYGDSKLFDDAVVFFAAVDPGLPTLDERRALSRVKDLLGKLDTHRHPEAATTPPELAQLDAMIDRLVRDPGDKFRAMHGARAVGFMRTALENLRAFYQFWHMPMSLGGADDNPLGVIEGRNVVFLADEYFPGRKLIVWAHNGHVARGTSEVTELEKKFKFNETIATGQRIYDEMGDAVYSVMLIAHGGKSNGWWGESRDLAVADEGSMEDLFHRAGFKQAFVDLRGLPREHWLRRQLVARPVSYAPMRADWSGVFDGVFFIDVMTPSTIPESGP